MVGQNKKGDQISEENLSVEFCRVFFSPCFAGQIKAAKVVYASACTQKFHEQKRRQGLTPHGGINKNGDKNGDKDLSHMVGQTKKGDRIPHDGIKKKQATRVYPTWWDNIKRRQKRRQGFVPHGGTNRKGDKKRRQGFIPHDGMI